MTVDTGRGVSFLIAAFNASDGYLAVVDNGYFVGLFGQREFIALHTVVTSCEHLLFDNVSDLVRMGYVNQACSRITASGRIDVDLYEFFDQTAFRYVPVVSAEGLFMYFAKRKGEMSNTNTDRSRSTKLVLAERWGTSDALAHTYDDYNFVCTICGGDINTRDSEKRITHCIFGGGKLIRYVCNCCGAVIGPLKMLELTQEELDYDYAQHYSVYQEGDTTEDEVATFRMMEPRRDGRYLNYGCGGDWSRSIATLRQEGYDVWGYEPYAKGSGLDYVIDSKDALKHLKFNGIFSNNLIEHLKDPVGELRFMKSLLRDCVGSCMAHSTGCYEYRYAYTRFHLHFPIGGSAERMYRSAGLMPYKSVKKILHNDTYVCICVKPAGKDVVR